MRRMKVPARAGFCFRSMLFVASVTCAQLLGAQTSETAPPAAANENYVYCFSDVSAKVIYSSEIFAAVLPQVAASRMRGAAQRIQTPVFQDAFRAFLQKKYAFASGSNNPTSCVITFAPTAAGFQAAQAHRQRIRDLATANKAQFVETGWKYTPPE